MVTMPEPASPPKVVLNAFKLRWVLEPERFTRERGEPPLATPI